MSDLLSLKSFSSSNVKRGKYLTPLWTLFGEYSNYNILRNYTKYVPGADLVYINGNRDDIMVVWKDDFPNNIREIGNVNWSDTAKAALFAGDNAHRYLEAAGWKTRNADNDR